MGKLSAGINLVHKDLHIVLNPAGRHRGRRSRRQ